MSIIQDALKRAQERPEKPMIAPDVIPEKQSVSPSNKIEPSIVLERSEYKRKDFSKLRIFLGFILTVIVLIFAFSLKMLLPVGNLSGAVRTSYKITTTEASIPQQSPPDRAAQASVPGRPDGAPFFPKILFKASSKFPELVLSGIMYLESGPRAIINNVIVGKGDTICGAIVRVINRKSVVLESGDTEVTLNLK
jgi:hypothetical protein